MENIFYRTYKSYAKGWQLHKMRILNTVEGKKYTLYCECLEPANSVDSADPAADPAGNVRQCWYEDEKNAYATPEESIRAAIREVDGEIAKLQKDREGLELLIGKYTN